MRLYQRSFKKLLNKLISSKFRHLLLKVIGLNNYITLILKSVKIKGNLNARQNILCVEKGLFEKDVDELSYRVRQYGWIWLSKRQLTVYQDKIIPKKYRGQRKYIQHIDKIPDEWAECIRRSKVLIKRLKDEKNVCAIFLANLDYWTDYSLQAACKELKIPVIVLQKEFPYNDLNYFERFKKHYVMDYTPLADAIMVFGQRMKNVLSELKSFDQNRIFVTGAPRIDRWRSLELSGGIKKGLLMISFNDEERTLKTFCKMVFFISNYFKNEKLGKITIKAKNKPQSIELIQYCKKKNIDNVVVVHSANIYDLVLQTKAIVGLNSLATIESMLSKAPIIIPNWIIKDINNKVFNKDNEICYKSLEFAENIENLVKIIAKHLRNNNTEVSDETVKARKKFLSEFWEYNPMVTSCGNVKKIIESLVRN